MSRVRGRRGLTAGARRVGDGVLRRPDGQRFGRRHHGRALGHPAEGATRAVAGDTVWIRGGTYRVTTPANSGAGINFNKSGTSDTNRIKYWAYPGEVPLFDFSGLVISTAATRTASR